MTARVPKTTTQAIPTTTHRFSVRLPSLVVCGALLVGCLLLSGISALAEDAGKAPVSDPVSPVPQDPTNFASGLTVNPYAAGALDRGDEGSAMGGGVNMEYFFTEQIGVGMNYAVFAFEDEVHTVSADVVLRYPVSKAIVAPYLLVGGGLVAQDGDSEGMARLGGGIDVNLLQSNLGVFADGIYHWVEGDDDFTIARLGVRLPF